MLSLKDSLNATMDSLLIVVEKPCPVCGGEMKAWKNKDRNGKDRCPPVCTNLDCRFKSMKIEEVKSINERYEKNLKDRAINFLKYSSEYPNKELVDCRLETYKQIDNETDKASVLAFKFVQSYFNGNENHLILTGKSGVGKSHLAMGICWDILERSNYSKRCLFINIASFFRNLKFSMNDKTLYKQLEGNLLSEIKICDVLVIDDLGAELEIKGGTLGNYDHNTLSLIMESRENKATIFTSNLNAKEIQESYGNRIYSRLNNNSNGFTMRFNETSDKRLTGV
ncbi:MAG: DNA replication protein [Caudoviricetes sp.]|nr:MAG: DNA replication protein [Caudoviricetes sp.]